MDNAADEFFRTNRSAVSPSQIPDRHVCRASARPARAKRANFARSAIACFHPNAPTCVDRHSKQARTLSASTVAACSTSARKEDRKHRCVPDRTRAGLCPAADPERAMPRACYEKVSTSNARAPRDRHPDVERRLQILVVDLMQIRPARRPLRQTDRLSSSPTIFSLPARSMLVSNVFGSASRVGSEKIFHVRRIGRFERRDQDRAEKRFDIEMTRRRQESESACRR